MIFNKLPNAVEVPRYPHDWPFKLYVLNVEHDQSKGFREFTGPGGHAAGEYGYQLYYRDFEREAAAVRKVAEEMAQSMGLPAVRAKWQERLNSAHLNA